MPGDLMNTHYAVLEHMSLLQLRAIHCIVASLEVHCNSRPRPPPPQGLRQRCQVAHRFALGGAPVGALLVVHAAHVDELQMRQGCQAGQRRGDLQEDDNVGS